MINNLYPDLVLLNGSIYTINSTMGKARALAIKGDKVINIGESYEIERCIGHYTKIFDLEGKTVLPGFIDCHTHFTISCSGFHIDLYSVASKEEALSLINTKIKEISNEKWVIGKHWDAYRWQKKEAITKEELDALLPDNPAILVNLDLHEGIVNSKGLEVLKLPRDIPIFDESNGMVREKALENALRGIDKSADLGVVKERIETLINEAVKMGVTSIQVMSDLDEKDLKAYTALLKEGKLKVRVYLMPYIHQLGHLLKLGLTPGFGNEWITIGAVKIIADGDIASQTAAMSSPYPNSTGYKGALRYSREDLKKKIIEAHRAGLQLAIHAIGDRAIDLVQEGIEDALTLYPLKEHRHRIEHFELANPNQMDKAARLGIIASMQPCLLARSYVYEKSLGEGWGKRNNLLKQVADKGITIVFGSDIDPACAMSSPLYGIHWAVNTPNPRQRLGVEEAIKSYTSKAAFASFEEDLKGTIEPGKLADLVILSDNPFEQQDRIKEIKVLMTIVGGKPRFINENFKLEH